MIKSLYIVLIYDPTDSLLNSFDVHMGQVQERISNFLIESNLFESDGIGRGIRFYVLDSIGFDSVPYTYPMAAVSSCPAPGLCDPETTLPGADLHLGRGTRGRLILCTLRGAAPRRLVPGWYQVGTRLVPGWYSQPAASGAASG